MARRVLADEARRRKRRLDTANWRSRQRRGIALFKLEAGSEEFDLAIRFGGLKESQINDKTQVSLALGRLLRRGIVALLDQQTRRR
jgi:hypothetical protein